MAHLWIREPASEWSILSLVEDSYALDVVPPQAFSARPALASGSAQALLVRSAAEEAEAWFVVAPGHGETHVNGLPLVLGVRALSDRDEIRLAGTDPVFFSTETLAVVGPFPGSPQPVICPRCALPIETGGAAVRCPRCGMWHHESDERRCWTYARTCYACPQPTALDAGYSWSPEEL
jgi:hypothetical protein